jgi:hypothetical protein
MGERSARERDAAYGLPRLERPHLGDDAPLAQAGHEQIEAAEFEVAAEDGFGRLCFRLIDRNPAILRVIAERRRARASHFISGQHRRTLADWNKTGTLGSWGEPDSPDLPFG